MNCHRQVLHRILQLYSHWDPSLRLSRLGTLRNNQAVITVPQGKGLPGWLILTRNPNPVSYFVNRNGEITQLRIVFDERCFEDTILRVEKTSTHLYLADVWMFNGNHMFNITTFQQRHELLKVIYSTFYTSCPVFESLAIELRDNMKDIRGYEYYTNECGYRGIFIENKPDENESDLEIVRTDIPDVYRIPSNGDYLQVKTLKLSEHLRSMGDKFMLRCTNNKDGTWSPLLSSKPVTNED